MRSFDRGSAGAGLALIVESLAGGLIGAGIDVAERAGGVDTHGQFHSQWYNTDYVFNYINVIVILYLKIQQTGAI